MYGITCLIHLLQNSFIVFQIGESVFLLFLVEIKSLMESLPLTCEYLYSLARLTNHPLLLLFNLLSQVHSCCAISVQLYTYI